MSADMRDPTDQAASSAPDADLRPASVAKATEATSLAPNRAPENRKATRTANAAPWLSTGLWGWASSSWAEPSCGSPGDSSGAPPRRRRGWGSGSVPRWERNHSPPMSWRLSDAIQPLVTGSIDEVHRAVVRTGPMMRATSSKAASREKAVCTSSGRVTTVVHRDRTSEPIEPDRPPASAASAMSSHRSACALVARMSPNRAVPEAASAGSITLDCPRSSTSRARAGAPRAAATMLAAATAPAAE